MPRAQQVVRQRAVPVAPRVDNEARRAFRFQADVGLGHRLAEVCQKRGTHRIAVQILPLYGARGDCFRKHELDRGVVATVVAHGPHATGQSLGSAKKRLDAALQGAFVNDEVRPVRDVPTPT